MHWSLYVLIGAVLNALVNLGYKTSATKEGIFGMVACVMLCSAIVLFGFSFVTKENFKIGQFMTSLNPLIIVGMGFGTAAIFYFFINAMAKGPYSLVDPMWACIYAVTSVTIGMFLLREAPSMTALAGVGLYLAGAYLMSRG